MEEEQEFVRTKGGFWFPLPSTLATMFTEREEKEEKREEEEKKSVLDTFEGEDPFSNDITPT